MKKYFNILGMMSGTSMDGIDATIVKTNGCKLIRSGINLSKKYSEKTTKLLQETQVDINATINNSLKLKNLSKLVTIDHANVALEIINKSSDTIDLIGFHGQTLYHDTAQKLSFQIGDPVLLANLLKIKVVSNFRDNDINLGGEGAPLAPVYHERIMQELTLKLPLCFVNIGGVSNLTFSNDNKLIGFDTGPGNGLMDTYIQNTLNLRFDQFGQIASKGVSEKQLIKYMLQDPFFKKKFPKSLDKNHFNYIFNNQKFKSLSVYDAMATLLDFTVSTIIMSIKLLPENPNYLVLMGGGAFNKELVKLIKHKFNKTLTASEIGLEAKMIEAELIAFLSARSVYNIPYTYPSTTGTIRPISGGVLYNFYKNPN